MSLTLATFTDRVKSRLKDTTIGTARPNLATADFTVYARGALQRYQRDVPRVISLATADLPTGNGTAFLSLPATFVVGHSSLVLFEYPVDQSPTVDYQPGSGVYVDELRGRFVTDAFVVPSGSKYRAVHTSTHTLSGLDSATSTTIIEPHEEAFCDLGTAKALLGLAGFYRNTSDSTLPADVVDYKGAGRDLERLVDSYMSQYDAVVKAPEKPSGARASFVSWGNTVDNRRADLFTQRSL